MDSAKLEQKDTTEFKYNIDVITKETNLSEAEIEIQQLIKEADLSEEELGKLYQFADKINVLDHNEVMQYGIAIQSKMADFSDKILKNVALKETNEVGPMITKLISELKSMDKVEDKGFLAIFKKKENTLETLKVRFNAAESNVTAIARTLEEHQIILLKDINILDKMYELNLNCFRDLTKYVIAGKIRIEKFKKNELAQLENKAKQTGSTEDIQTANDYVQILDRFEKKIHDLEISRVISMQTGPQIRMVQNSNTVMVEKIQSTIVNTIPLWKSQMVIALGSEHSIEAAKAQQAVSDMTNELLKRNASALKTATIETAKEANRDIVDIETLKTTNEMLISTFDEVAEIQAKGQENRAKVENELKNMEDKIKERLMVESV